MDNNNDLTTQVTQKQMDKTIHKKHRLNIFLTDFPLYKKFCAVENFKRTEKDYTCPIYLQSETFSYYCENENEVKTFELKLPIATLNSWRSKMIDEVTGIVLIEDDFLDYTHHFVGTCQSCKKFEVDFLLHVWSDKPISSDERNMFQKDEKTGENVPIDDLNPERANIYIEKVGIKPERTIQLDRNINKYFDRETENWYFKAQKSLSDNLGIAAFAYFRRIIEKELISIVRDISDLNSADHKLKQLVSEFNETNQPYSIYENIFQLLPKSLQTLGDNPFKILYKQTSEGLHSLSEKECLERAEIIDLVLKFVIKTINEEKSEISDVRNALRKLK